MTDRLHSSGFTTLARRPPVLPAALLAAAAIVAMALAAGQHWLVGGFALVVSALFALVRKTPDSNELDVSLPLGGEARGGRR